MNTEKHIRAICKEAGWDTMAEIIIHILMEREEIDEQFLYLRAEDITKMAEGILYPALDAMQEYIESKEQN